MEKKYEILIWPNKMWNEIPQQENPAYLKTTFFELGQPAWFALVICKVLPYESGVTGANGYVVCDVSSDVPDVLRLGVFWDIENAKIFTEAYVNYKEQLNTTKTE